MKQTIDFYAFERAFIDMNRADNFSYEGKRALFDWIEELDEQSDTETEFDVIALCCEFSEYGSALEAYNEYTLDQELEGDDDEKEEQALDYLHDRTTVICLDGGVVVACF